MILNLYHKLAEICNSHLIVIENKLLTLSSGEPQKLRIYLIDKTILDVWFTISGKYSFHWDRKIIGKGIYRFDNAPHRKWSTIKTYPNHLHFKSEYNVRESLISNKPEKALVEVLDFAALIIANEER